MILSQILRNKVIIEKITVINDKGYYYLAYELIEDVIQQTLKKVYSPWTIWKNQSYFRQETNEYFENYGSEIFKKKKKDIKSFSWNVKTDALASVLFF